jgi:glycosyltransferase involved in cell wall biosynthesis
MNKQMPIKKILIISYQYYPLIAPRAFRWHAIAEEMSKNGYQVDIVCCAFHNLPNYEVINNNQIHRIKPWFFKTFYRKNIVQWHRTESETPSEKKLEDHITPSKNTSNQKYISKFIINPLISLFSKIYHFFWWPDFGMFWIPPAIKKCRKLIKENAYNRVISVSWPVSGHVVGYFLYKDLHLRKTPLIVDVGDPFSLNEFTYSNNILLYKSLNLFFEKKLFQKSKGISVTNQAIKDLYIEKFLIDHKKIIVIPPMIDISISTNISNPLYKGNAKNKKILYIGSFRKGNRSPDLLFKLFADLLNQRGHEDLELHLMGDHHEFAKEIKEFGEKFKNNVFSYGLVSRETAVYSELHADFLINIGNNSAHQIPSKLIEYVYTGKPIINIQQISHDSSYYFLQNYPLLTNLDFHNQNYQTNLEKFLILVKNAPENLTQDTIKDILVKYSVEKITSTYLTNWWQ